jgi:hypothetical protein
MNAFTNSMQKIALQTGRRFASGSTASKKPFVPFSSATAHAAPKKPFVPVRAASQNDCSLRSIFDEQSQIIACKMISR